MADDSPRTMRDTFSVWNFDRVEREVVLRSSDDQYVAVPLREADADLFGELVKTSETVEATLVRAGDSDAVWRVERVHGVDGRR